MDGRVLIIERPYKVRLCVAGYLAGEKKATHLFQFRAVEVQQVQTFCSDRTSSSLS